MPELRGVEGRADGGGGEVGQCAGGPLRSRSAPLTERGGGRLPLPPLKRAPPPTPGAQGKSVAEAVAWALQPGSAGVPAEVLSELAPFLAGVGTASPPTASLHDMVWEVTKVPHCQLPGAFVNSLYAAATSAGYAEAVRRNIAAGGDNCSRGIYSAALWAAAVSAGGGGGVCVVVVG